MPLNVGPSGGMWGRLGERIGMRKRAGIGSSMPRMMSMQAPQQVPMMAPPMSPEGMGQSSMPMGAGPINTGPTIPMAPMGGMNPGGLWNTYNHLAGLNQDMGPQQKRPIY